MSSSFRKAREEITGDSWLDDLCRMSLSKAEAKFSGQETAEILSDPEAMAELAAADEAIANGDVVRGTESVRALRPQP